VLSHARQIFLRFFPDARMASFPRGHVAALVSVWVYLASDAQFDALLAPATRDAIYVALLVVWVLQSSCLA
jgi:hypothetical protein